MKKKSQKILLKPLNDPAIFGKALRVKAGGTIARQYVIAPFSVLSARDGYWQLRKQAWLDLGIQSELGGRDKMKVTGTKSGSVPRFYEFKAKTEKKLGRKISNREFEQNYLPFFIQKSRLAYTKTGGIISVFDPVLCELIYRWFCPLGGQVIDPFAGGSVRGIVAARLGYSYWGCDLRPDQVKENRRQAARIVPGNRPTWICGDALDVLEKAPQADLVFSCPPYGDLERYSDDPRDLSTMDYYTFIATYKRIILRACKKLKPNRFACFVVSSFRDRQGNYRDFLSDTVAAFRDQGLHFYNEGVLITPVGSLPIRITKQFRASRKLGKCHQNIMVFVKGDGKKAAQEIEQSQL
jgi:DNA modification methylase